MKKLLIIAILLTSPLMAQEEELEIRWDNKNYRYYASILNRFDFQGFNPFSTGYYPINDTLIAEAYIKGLEANVYFHIQARFSFMLNETTLPMNKFSTGVLLGLSGFVYNNVNAMGKGTSILMYGGVAYSSSFLEPEIGIRVNYNFNKDMAITYGLDLGYYWFTYSTKEDMFSQIEYISHHGFMIGMTVGLTFNSNYKKIDS